MAASALGKTLGKMGVAIGIGERPAISCGPKATTTPIRPDASVSMLGSVSASAILEGFASGTTDVAFGTASGAAGSSASCKWLEKPAAPPAAAHRALPEGADWAPDMGGWAMGVSNMRLSQKTIATRNPPKPVVLGFAGMTRQV
jgi:hypothetical protein